MMVGAVPVPMGLYDVEFDVALETGETGGTIVLSFETEDAIERGFETEDAIEMDFETEVGTWI